MGEEKGKRGRGSQNSTAKEIKRRRRRKPTFKVDITVIEQEDLDLASIIRVDDSGTGIDEIFHRESAPGSDAAVFCAKRRFGRELVGLLGEKMSEGGVESEFSWHFKRILNAQRQQEMIALKSSITHGIQTPRKPKGKGMKTRQIKISEKQKKRSCKSTKRRRTKNSHVPSGTAMAKSVSTIPFPRAGIVVGRAL